MVKQDSQRADVTTMAQAVPFSLSAERVDRLLLAAREGDDLAFEELLRLHRGPVYRLALGMLNVPEEAAEVCQDVFLRFFRSLRNLRAERGIKSWLRRVTVHRCYDVLRSRKKRSDIEAELIPGCMQPDSEADQKELSQWLRYGLDKLSPRERAALILTCHQGFSSDEAGEAMGCRPATVRVLVHKGREKLKALLGMGGDRRNL